MGKENLLISKEKLKRLYIKEKMPMSKIAKKFGCNHNSIAIKMKKYGIKSRTTSESVKLFIKKDKIKIPKKSLIKLYKEGVALEKIAKIYGCSMTTVMRRLRRYGFSLKRSKGQKVFIKKRELEDLYLKQKLSTYEIAEKFGCCQATIWKKLREFGIKGRKPNELNSKVPSKKELIDFYVKNKLSTWEIQKRHGFSRSTVHRKLREHGIKVRSPAVSHMIYPRHDFSGNLIEKAYLIGFRIGDLRVRKIWNGDTIKADCGTTKKEQIELFKRLFSKYGYVWVSKPTKSGKIQFEIGLNNSFLFLLTKEVPEWIINDKRHFFSFLAGFIDAEGSIKIYNNQARLSIGNYDLPLLKLIKKQLQFFGIESPKIYESDTSKYITPDGYGHNQNYFSFRMTKKAILLKLLNILQLYIKHEGKVKDLKEAKLNIIKRNKKLGVK